MGGRFVARCVAILSGTGGRVLLFTRSGLIDINRRAGNDGFVRARRCFLLRAGFILGCNPDGRAAFQRHIKFSFRSCGCFLFRFGCFLRPSLGCFDLLGFGQFHRRPGFRGSGLNHLDRRVQNDGRTIGAGIDQSLIKPRSFQLIRGHRLCALTVLRGLVAKGSDFRTGQILNAATGS